MSLETIRVIDSHTAGEPTRVVLEGGPDLGEGTLLERLRRFRADFDHYRAALVREPRGSDAMVGALLVEPGEPGCTAGAIFFNNVGYLGMCGHGTMGLLVTLAHEGHLRPGRHRVDTPAGVVTAELLPDRRVAVRNVASYRWASDVSVEVEGRGTVRGDVAWGGNWFFIAEEPEIELASGNVPELTDLATRIRRALERSGARGECGAEIDHIELSAPSPTPGLDSRNFVLCPGGAYDRSPCGTGTSARLACLSASGKLAPGGVWRQEGIVGGVFEATYRADPERSDRILPTVVGSAYVTSSATLLLDPEDPFCWGIGGSCPGGS